MKSEKNIRCEEFRSEMLDVAASLNAAPPGAASAADVASELPPHARECAECAAELASLRSTMQLLDEWNVPEPSPYFDTRLKARLREEATQVAGQSSSLAWWFRRLRVPALAAAMFAAGFTGYSIYQQQQTPAKTAYAQVSGVTDLQTLDKQYDTLDELESLDDAASAAPDAGL